MSDICYTLTQLSIDKLSVFIYKQGIFQGRHEESCWLPKGVAPLTAGSPSSSSSFPQRRLLQHTVLLIPDERMAMPTIHEFLSVALLQDIWNSISPEELEEESSLYYLFHHTCCMRACLAESSATQMAGPRVSLSFLPASPLQSSRTSTAEALSVMHTWFLLIFNHHTIHGHYTQLQMFIQSDRVHISEGPLIYRQLDDLIKPEHSVFAARRINTLNALNSNILRSLHIKLHEHHSHAGGSTENVFTVNLTHVWPEHQITVIPASSRPACVTSDEWNMIFALLRNVSQCH